MNGKRSDIAQLLKNAAIIPDLNGHRAIRQAGPLLFYFIAFVGPDHFAAAKAECSSISQTEPSVAGTAKRIFISDLTMHIETALAALKASHIRGGQGSGQFPRDPITISWEKNKFCGAKIQDR
jgi:hypothetical protein